jgi:hypothetical protein
MTLLLWYKFADGTEDRTASIMRVENTNKQSGRTLRRVYGIIYQKIILFGEEILGKRSGGSAISFHMLILRVSDFIGLASTGPDIS